MWLQCRLSSGFLSFLFVFILLFFFVVAVIRSVNCNLPLHTNRFCRRPRGRWLGFGCLKVASSKFGNKFQSIWRHFFNYVYFFLIPTNIIINLNNNFIFTICTYNTSIHIVCMYAFACVCECVRVKNALCNCKN